MTNRFTKALLAGFGGLALLTTSAHLAHAAPPPSGRFTIGPIGDPGLLGAPVLVLECDATSRFSLTIEGNTGPFTVIPPNAGLVTLCVALFGGLP